MNDTNNSYFGKWVTSTHRLNKIYKRDNTRTWMKQQQNISGIFLGIRYLQTGHPEYDYSAFGDLECVTFNETAPRIKAALVAKNAIENPIYVPADCVKLDDSRLVIDLGNITIGKAK